MDLRFCFFTIQNHEDGERHVLAEFIIIVAGHLIILKLFVVSSCFSLSVRGTT